MNNNELKELYNSLSIEEKIGQLFQVTGYLLDSDEVLTGPLCDIGLTEEDIKLSGSVVGLGSKGAESLTRIQKKHIERHPKGIPLIFMMDIIHGYRTIYPMPLAMGATFNPELMRECAEMAAVEGAASGVHATFSPMVDLVRDIRWGRVLESTGEDVYLNCVMARSMVEGYQGTNIAGKGTLAACVKHFAAYGAAEGGRDYNSVELSERTLRDFYLPAYKAAIDAGCKLVMTAFNTVDGIPSTANKKLMRNILRTEMGFNNTVISDFGAISELVMHGLAENGAEAARLSLEAGCDIDMMSGSYSRYIKELIEKGEVSEELLEESVMRVLQLKNELGLFENPYKGADVEREKEICLCERHKQIALRAAAESFVLLKNEDSLLPLDKAKKIAFIGPYIDRRELLSSWAITGETEDVSTILEEHAAYSSEIKAGFAKGCPILPGGTVMDGFTALEPLTATEGEVEEYKAEAVELAKNSDIAVLFIGEHYLQSGEAASRSNPSIPEIQRELFEAIYRVNKNIVVVLFSGRPLVLDGLEEKAGAILNVWMPGTMGAKAIWKVLLGEMEPSGRLPMSFPVNVGQIPVHYDELRTGRPWMPDEKERFQSKYLDVRNAPLYSFGYGLGYTEFEISKVSLSDAELTAEGA